MQTIAACSQGINQSDGGAGGHDRWRRRRPIIGARAQHLSPSCRPDGLIGVYAGTLARPTDYMQMFAH